MKTRKLKCPREQCGHVWDSRVIEPRSCPRCKQYPEVPFKENND